ncbi:MAG: hypothetical protein IKR74_04565 [Bacilli bacterium]|nr:hypothetical protein [Bacilli bacterium]
MIELEQIMLENGVAYSIIREKESYVYLINPQDENDFCIRKNVTIDGEEYLKKLDSKEEFDYALSIFKNEDE